MHKQNLFRLIVWTLVASMPLWFGGCGSKNDSVTPASVEGTWQYASIKMAPAILPLQNGTKTGDLLVYLADLSSSLGTTISSADLTSCFTTSRITFNAGGKITQTPGAKCTTASTSATSMVEPNATWKLDGSKLTITDSSGSEVYDTAFSGNTLKMSQTDSSTDYDGDGKKDTVTLTLELTKV